MSRRPRRVRTLADVAAAFTRRRREREPEPPSVPLRPPTPLRYGTTPVAQYDQTTCVSTCLLLLAAHGDPALADWLAEGTVPAGRLPAEIPPGLIGASPTAAQRLAGAQQRVKDSSLKRSLGPFRWPGSLGTPPWAAARQARHPGARYRHLPVDDRGARGRAAAAMVGDALARGLPVILYTGGAFSSGMQKGVPRHAVLALPAEAGTATLFEPSSAMLYHVSLASLAGRTSPSREFGNWTHMQWLVLP